LFQALHGIWGEMVLARGKTLADLKPSACLDRRGGLYRRAGLSTLMHQIGQKNGAAMAQKVQALFIDDLDGSEADGTVHFGLGGAEYEIDLNTEHAQQLRDALASYISAARRAAGTTRSPARSTRKPLKAGPNSTEVREAAREARPAPSFTSSRIRRQRGPSVAVRGTADGVARPSWRHGRRPLTCIAAVTASGFAMVRLPFWGVLHCAPLP
jgi:hypothetical protein